MLGDRFKGVVDVLDWGDSVVDPDQLLVVKKETNARGAVVRVGNLEAVAHRSVNVTKKGKGEIVFVGEGFLFGNGIHRNSDGFDFGGGEFLR